MVARSTDNLESSGEPATRSVGTTANLKGKMSKRVSVVKGHFPKLVDCAHFHYENVDFGSIELQFGSEQSDANWNSSSAKDMVFLVQVSCQGKTWAVRRSYDEFCTLDAHLHQCIYDRRYSQLLPLPALSEIGDRPEVFTPLLSEYLSRLSMIVDNKLNCGPVLTWMEIDNRGNHFMLKEEASLNVPAIAAAHVVKRYAAQASDEISIEVGDILSVIDMPPKEDTSWWRGKHGFQVGFFPSECVELINEKLPQSVNASATKTDADPVSSKPAASSSPGPQSPTSVSKKHGKLMGFLRTFMKSRPSKQKLKQRGILKERVFGCDLGEHLLNSGLDVPQVLKSCSEFIELHGVVDGIYRHSGVSSNIQKLRHEFDSENVPDLTRDMYMQDIHCVGSLCKLYFRELPNPLLTYQLYDKFADCMGEMTDDERMVKVHDVIQQLPPPHYRTLEYLIRHLAGLATCSGETNMHIKNLAIVWAPNLLRSMAIEAVGLSGADPFKEVRIQSVVVEFLLSNVDVLFSDSFTSVGRFSTAGRQSLNRPKSFVSTRLLSLEEAQARTQAPLLLQGAPLSLQGQYHTVLDLPVDRRKRGVKVRKAAGGSWKTFFAIGKPAGAGRRKPIRISSLFQPTTSHAGCRVDSVTLRSAKSEESLSSQHSGAGQVKVQRLRRPRSSSDGLSLAASMDPQLLPQRPPSRLPSSRSYDSLLPDDRPRPGEEGDDEDEDEEEEEEEEEGVYMLPDLSHPDPAPSWHDEDIIDFSPTFLEDGPIAVASTRDSPPTASPPPYRCLSHQGHASSSGQRSITEDPDSVLNQSEANARRSLIVAATAPPLQVFCQHRPSNSSPAATQAGEATNQSPSHGQSQPPAAASSAPSSHPAPERRSFTRKMVHALSHKAPKSPLLDISDPIAISVPAKVLEMIGGRAGELPPGAAPPSGPPQAPQMISMLLRSCDFQLSESCQQEIRSKLGPAPDLRVRGIPGPTGALLPSQQPPPPPPKNPARLMALALAESANKALRQGASPPYRPRLQDGSPAPPPAGAEPRYQRSLSADAGELLASDPNQLYSTVRPLSVWDQGAAETTEDGDALEDRAPGQDTGTLSSDTSVSDSVASELSGSSSGDGHTPSPVYTNQSQASRPSPTRPQSQRKPPAYSRQFSAPHLQQKSAGASAPPQPPAAPPGHPQLMHSKSESSPLSQLRSFQPARPKVPPKPLDLAVQRDRPPQRPLLAKSELRRSLDSGRVRRTFGQQPQGNPPLTRAFSERLSGPDMLARYHAARPGPQGSQPPKPGPPQQAHIRPVAPSSSDDQGKGENFYYEIAGPDPPQGPPSYARHSYQNMRLDLEGNFRPAPHPHPDPGSRPQSRGHQQPKPPYPGAQHSPQLWSSEATRAWAAAHTHGPHSQSFSHGHAQQQHPQEGPRPRPQRQPSASVRLARSEVHPLPSSSIVPLSVHQRGSGLRPPDLTSSQLHPFFENGRVCYRPQAEEPPPTTAQADRRAVRDRPEPVYVNYPFASTPPHPLTPRTDPPAAAASDPGARSWANTDLDRHDSQLAPSEQQHTEPAGHRLSSEQGAAAAGPAPPPDSPAARDDPAPSLSPPASQHPEGRSLPAPSASPGAHYRSRSDPQSSGGPDPRPALEGRTEGPQGLTAKDIASLLIDKLAEDERAEPSSNVTSSSASSSSSPQLDHPPNPYAQHPPPPPHAQPPPAYNVYTPGPSRSRGSGAGGVFHRQDPARRSSSGGQYRQAYDVMPSGDQVLKFYRSGEFTPGEATAPGPSPFSPRQQQYPEPPYPSRSSFPAAGSPSAALAGLSPGGPRPYPPPQYHSQPGPAPGQYPNTPRRDQAPDPSLRPAGLRNQRGLTRQASLPGPNWTIHTEGQTRSYC